MESEKNWKWNDVSVNDESLYSILEIVQQQRRKEGSVCLYIIRSQAMDSSTK